MLKWNDHKLFKKPSGRNTYSQLIRSFGYMIHSHIIARAAWTYRTGIVLMHSSALSLIRSMFQGNESKTIVRRPIKQRVGAYHVYMKCWMSTNTHVSVYSTCNENCFKQNAISITINDIRQIVNIKF